jgi:hypothetical protein
MRSPRSRTEELFPPILLSIGDPPEQVRIDPMAGGSLHCFSCRKDFCHHIKSALRANMDAHSLWKQIDLDQTMFVIPLRPDQGMSHSVRLERKNGSRDFVRVISSMEPKKSLDRFGVDDFIGFLNRGEGRIHMRQMIVSWFEPIADVRLHTRSCTSTRHSFTREARIAALADIADARTEIFTTCWRLIFKGMCEECWSDRRSGFASDLIP